MRILISVFSVILVTAFALFFYLLVVSRGVVAPYTDDAGHMIAGSIAEKIKVKINGVEQGMFLRGKSSENPVLLFIHGGPGVPEFFLNETYPTDLEEYFTVCWWEARGAGLSYSDDTDPAGITTKQLIMDTISVTEYLNQRFDKEKIYLMGHSFGTIIGLGAALERPDLYTAYIGMSQAGGNEWSNAVPNTLSYNYMKNVFIQRDDIASQKKLDQYSEMLENGTVTFDPRYLAQLDELKHKAGCGTMHHMDSAVTGIFIPQMNSSCYTLAEKIDYWRGRAMMRSSGVSVEMLRTDLFKESLSLALPVYFFHGIYDYTCPYPLALEYYQKIDAPHKEFFTFEHSAHSPLWEEPDRAVEILKEIRSHSNH